MNSSNNSTTPSDGTRITLSFTIPTYDGLYSVKDESGQDTGELKRRYSYRIARTEATLNRGWLTFQCPSCHGEDVHTVRKRFDEMFGTMTNAEETPAGGTANEKERRRQPGEGAQ